MCAIPGSPLLGQEENISQLSPQPLCLARTSLVALSAQVASHQVQLLLGHILAPWETTLPLQET